MKRLLLLLFLLMAAAAAQTSDLTVQLFSRFDVSAAKLVPSAGARLSGCGSTERAVTSPVELSIRAGELTVDGQPCSGGAKVTGGFRVEFSAGEARPWSGTVRVRARKGRLQFLTLMSLEDYTAAAVEGETAAEMPDEALKAMAVVARTFAVHFRSRHAAAGYDLCDDTHCQNLHHSVSRRVRAAVAATRGELLWHNGSPAAPYYHRDCGGHTEDAASLWPSERAPYLVSQDDPYCKRVTTPWRVEISRADIDRALLAAGLKAPAGWERLEVTRRTASGRAAELRLATRDGRSAAVSASSFRFALGRTLGWMTLKSDFYQVSASGGGFVFRGRGVGHGVGLCQLGAAEMAHSGMSYRQILAFYYPGTTVSVAASGEDWKTLAGARISLLYLSPAGSQETLQAAEAALRFAEQQTGLRLAQPIDLKRYPSVAMFRDATGEPGWVAARTRGSTIHLQPLTLQATGRVLRHEFLHLLLEQAAGNKAPLWLREGLALYFEGARGEGAPCRFRTLAELEKAISARDPQMKAAYDEAAALLAHLMARHGRTAVMDWLARGLPAGVAGTSTRSATSLPSIPQAASQQRTISRYAPSSRSTMLVVSKCSVPVGFQSMSKRGTSTPSSTSTASHSQYFQQPSAQRPRTSLRENP